MTIFLGLWGMLATLAALTLFTSAKSAIHEIEAGLAFLIATVSIGCAGIIYAINSNAKKLEQPASD